MGYGRRVCSTKFRRPNALAGNSFGEHVQIHGKNDTAHRRLGGVGLALCHHTSAIMLHLDV